LQYTIWLFESDSGEPERWDIFCDNDERAMSTAEALLDGHAFGEVDSRGRYVGRVEPLCQNG
jgi:hypothetical protein